MTKARTKIAVVDDEVPVRKALERLIRAAGLEVEVFGSGADFLDALLTRRIDCLVLDLHMPMVNGFEVLERLAQLGARLPVVVITGRDTPECRTRALANGATAYLLKPVDERLLLDEIATAIAKSSGDCT